MHSFISKTVYTLVFVAFSAAAIRAQSDKKFSFSLSYSPNLSSITNPMINGSIDYKFSQNAFLGVEYNASTWLKPTVSLGFLNTGERYSGDFTDEPGTIAGKAEVNFNNNYVAVPLGVKFFYKSMFFHPEIGFAYNVSNVNKTKLKYFDGSEIKRKDEPVLFGNAAYNTVNIPILFTVGNEFKIGRTRLLLGLKSYYGLNQVVNNVPRKNYYYGFGVFTGVKF